MNLSNASTQPRFLQLKHYWFECLILLLLALYTGFYCTPSSYGMALNMLGIPNDGLILGTPKAVRSDEWSVWTPYLQALVNNHFQRFNAYSIYHEDFRNFNALPIYDWALLFKPQFWSFLIAEPARAFSFHHGFLIATFLIGWKQLIAKIIQPYPYATPNIAIGFSLLLFFSGFIQTIWTTMGPIIAFFPWLMLVLLAWQRHSIRYYCLLSYTMATWLLSHTYPPLVVSMAYIGIMILATFQTDFFSNIKRCVLSVLACLAGVGIVVYYYKDVIPIMMDTVYPGQRVSIGGEGSFYIWLSTIIPYITHSSNGSTTIVDSLNICEATAVSSLLPLISVCFTHLPTIKNLFRKEIILFGGTIIFFSIWWLLPVPLFLGKILLLKSVPSHRLVFALGLTINMLALFLLVNYGTKLSVKRMLVFSILLILSWHLPDFFQSIHYLTLSPLFEKSFTMLIAIPLMGIMLIFHRYSLLPEKAIISNMVLIAAFINGFYFSLFNPIQSAQSIFTAKNSANVLFLQTLQKQHDKGWLIFPTVQGAVLNGLGLKSFSHTLIQPQLSFFRSFFPELSASEFNYIFNRYAHIELSDVNKPYVPKADVIVFPINKIIGNTKKEAVFSYTDCTIKAAHENQLEAASLNQNNLYLSGWIIGNEHRYLTNIKSSTLIKYSLRPRLDIASIKSELNIKDLIASGFSFEILLSEADVALMRQEGFCLFSESNKFGIKEIFNYSTADVKPFLLNFNKPK